MAKLAGDDLDYVVTDHVGTPREIVSEDGKRTAWKAKFGLWGNEEKIDIWRAEAANGGEVTCNIRFQGQWADEESGLHYNRFRYYDAEAGQYLSSDPIRLEGGPRPSGYVNDPNYSVDPLGLSSCPLRWDANAGRWRDSKGRFAGPPVAGSDVTTIGTHHTGGHFPKTPQAPNSVMYRADSSGNMTHYQV